MGHKLAKKQKTTELDSHKMALLKANTTFSEQEIEEWHKNFLRDHPSGKLDKENFNQVYKQFFDKNQSDQLSKFAFNTFDGSKNGEIDFEEFLIAITPHGKGDVRDRLVAAFDLYDHTNDGKIDLEDLITLIEAVYDITGKTDREGEHSPRERAIAIVKKLDVNLDGKISKQEFVSGCLNDPIVHRLLAPNA